MKVPLFHWSPGPRRLSISVNGLVPGSEPTIVPEAVPYICLGSDPATIWALTGELPWTARGEWDLWQVWLDDEIDVRIVVLDGDIVEIRVYENIPSAQLWLVGTRVN